MDLQELLAEPLAQAAPAGFTLDEVVVRLARADERIKWDALMDRHHYLGFKRFAGRGLRYVAEWRGRWVALAGWQVAALKCAPRDRWIGWRTKELFRRLHLVANNSRFVVLGERGVFANLASWMMSAMLRRLSDDWQAYRAANWTHVGQTQGRGKLDVHKTYALPRKDIWLYSLRRDFRRRLCAPLNPPPHP